MSGVTQICVKIVPGTDPENAEKIVGHFEALNIERCVLGSQPLDIQVAESACKSAPRPVAEVKQHDPDKGPFARLKLSADSNFDQLASAVEKVNAFFDENFGQTPRSIKAHIADRNE